MSGVDGALCYMVECTMASLEHARDIKRTAKSEIVRLERIVKFGLDACRNAGLADVAAEGNCWRVHRALTQEPSL